MQFTIVLDGSESPALLRRLSNTILALSGEMPVAMHTHVGVTTRANTIAPDDLPDAGADVPAVPPAPPVSATPLAPSAPPAPSTAAADLFPTVPAAPAAGTPAAPSAAVPPAPPVPGSAAPSAPAAPTSHAGGVELDKDGLPWDARIHSSSKEKNKDQTWRQRRNLADGERERVEKELRALMALPAAGVTVGDAPASAAPLPPPAPATSALAVPVMAPETTTASGDAPNVPPAPPAPPTSAPATAVTPTPPVPSAPTAAALSAPATGMNPFAEVTTKAATNVTAGKLTEAQVHAALASVGLQPNQMGMLAARHDLAAQVSQRLDYYLAGGA